VESPTLWAGVPSLHLFRDVTATRAQIRPLRPAAGPGTANPGGGGTGLTPRELEILRLMGTGANTRAVSEQLHVSPATVRNHVQSILTKLEVHSRLAAVAYAMNHGLL
jgi:DNA-binding NarL/FixJ family response regulator